MTTIEIIAGVLRYDRFNPNIAAEEIAEKIVEALKSAPDTPQEWAERTYEVATSKPAPDAMREALEPILNFARAIPDNIEDATGIAYAPFAHAMGIAASLTAGNFRALLSPPLPSPDGAGEAFDVMQTIDPNYAESFDRPAATSPVRADREAIVEEIAQRIFARIHPTDRIGRHEIQRMIRDLSHQPPQSNSEPR